MPSSAGSSATSSPPNFETPFTPNVPTPKPASSDPPRPEPGPTLPPDQDPIVARKGGGPNDRHPAGHHLLLSANGDLIARFAPTESCTIFRISDGKGLGGDLVQGVVLADDATTFAMLKSDEIQICNVERVFAPTYFHNVSARWGIFPAI